MGHHFNLDERVFILRPGKPVQEARVVHSTDELMVLATPDLSVRLGDFQPTPEQGHGVMVIHAGEGDEGRASAEWLAAQITSDGRQS